jgi:hypothetical protein
MAAAFVQGKGALGSTVSSLTVTFTSAVEVDNVIIATGAWTGEQNAEWTDNSGGNTYAEGTQWNHSSIGMAVQVAYSVNTVNAAHQVTINPGASNTRISLRVAEVSGLNNSDLLEDEVENEGGTADLVVPQVTTTVDGSFLITHVMGNTNLSFTKPTTYTIVSTASARSHAAYLIAGAAGNYSEDWISDGTAHTNNIIHAAFNAASAGTDSYSGRGVGRGIGRGVMR